jgi:hypothetical protein
MGCNSHLSIEYYTGTRWETYALDIPESRNYAIYELMAGVRGIEDNALFPPRGIPSDADNVTKVWFKRWETDGHTPSYLLASEYRKVFNACQKAEGYSLGGTWEALRNILSALEETYGDNKARVVFFFDN